MPQFIGWRIDGYDPDQATPIATGATKAEALDKALRRVLAACDLDSMVTAQERPELTADDFAKLTAVVDQWAARHQLD